MKGHAKATRLLRVLSLLSDGDLGTRDIAEQLGVSQRTISRDLCDLARLGVHVYRAGAGWTYRATPFKALDVDAPLSPMERELIARFRRLSDAQKTIVLQLLGDRERTTRRENGQTS